MVYSGFGAAVLFSIFIVKVFRFNGATASSILQGAARHNAFIALIVAERLFGSQGLSEAVLITAFLIPITNIVVVTLMIVLIKGGRQKGVFQTVLRDLITNPLLIAVTLGVGVNMLKITPIPSINEITDILGKAALPIMLLGVGANIRMKNLSTVGIPTFIATLGKMVVFPIVIFFVAVAMGASELTTMVAVIFGAVPTAVSSFTFARQLGGDSLMMSKCITMQTALSFFTMPLTLGLVQLYFN